MTHKDLQNSKVVFFAAETIPSASGSGKHAFLWARYFLALAQQSSVVCFNYNGKFKSKEQVDGVTIFRITYYNSNLITKLFSVPILLFSYIRHAVKNNMSFIYGSYMPGFELIIVINRFLRRKTVFQSTLLNSDDLKTLIQRTPLPLRALRRKLWSWITLYHAINATFAGRWQSVFRNKPYVISSQGVDNQVFKPQRAQSAWLQHFSVKPGKLILLCVGIVIERKGYRELFNELATCKLPFILLVAGLNTENTYHRSSRHELREMHELTELGHTLLKDKIRFLGDVQNISGLYSVADVLLHNAYQEGTPNAVLEAMACKTPVIIKDLDGLEYLVKNRVNALVFKKASEINRLITEICTDSELRERLTANAYSDIVEENTLQRVTTKIIEKIQ